MTLVVARRAMGVSTVGLVVPILAACAAAGPPPYAEISASARKVASAEVTVGNGPAQAELSAAQSKLEAAKAALAAGDNDRAWRLAVEAGLDAELAEALARAAAAERRLARQIVRHETTLPAAFRNAEAR